MGVNIRGDFDREEQERRFLLKHGESTGVAHARRSLQALQHIPFYARKLEKFIEENGG